MLRNYIKIALRNLLKHKIFSFINVFGLAVGMSICMLIVMLVADQMMNDRHNPNRNRIYRVNSVPYYNENQSVTGNENATAPLPLAGELKQYNDVEKSVRIVRHFGNKWLKLEPGNDINVPVSGYFADPEVFAMFGMKLKYGDAGTALSKPYSVVLTEKAVAKLFQVENPVGESLEVGELGTYLVTGVIEDGGDKSHIVAEAYASISTIESLAKADKLSNHLDDWNTYHAGWVYVMLKQGVNPERIEPYLSKISTANPNTNELSDVSGLLYILQPLLSITPGRLVNNPIGPFMPWVIIYFLSGLALVILLTSCFNFTNLSVARSISRAREIGVRKVTGALRRQIFFQFISESVIIALCALVVALLLITLIKPYMLELPFTQAMHWSVSTNYAVYLVFLALAVVVGLLAGFFPAVVLSGLKPIKVLKNLNTSKLIGRVGMRKALLVIQFSFSLIFILTVIVLYNQLNLFLHDDYGFDPKNKIVMQMGDSPEILKNELLANSNIESVTQASHLPLSGVVQAKDFRVDRDSSDWISLKYFSVGMDYLDNMGIQLKAGHFFTDESTAGKQIVLNEIAREQLGYASNADAIGQFVLNEGDSVSKQIVGVINNYAHVMASGDQDEVALLYEPERFSILQVAYSGDFEDASATVTSVWQKTNPNLKLEVYDFEEKMSELYNILFGSLTTVIGFITTLAVIISCMGLLGMATYTVETRKKEISLRKILGSTNKGLVYTLSKGYLSILMIAVVIAVPVAYFLNNLWLQNFVSHVSVDFLTILLGVSILIILGAFTIGSQTLKALFVNPVDNLRDE